MDMLFNRTIDWGPLRCQYVDARGDQCWAKRDHRNQSESLCFFHSEGADLLTPDQLELGLVELRRREAALMLSNASVEAAHRLVMAMDSERSDVALKASLEVLDRVGLGKAPIVSVEVNNNTVQISREALIEELNGRLDRLASASSVVSGQIEA